MSAILSFLPLFVPPPGHPAAGEIHRRHAASTQFLSQLAPPCPCALLAPTRIISRHRDQPRAGLPPPWSAMATAIPSPWAARSGESLTLLSFDLGSQ